MPNTHISLHAVPDIPLIEPGDDLVGLIADGLSQLNPGAQDGDIVVVSSKIVSKAEGRFVNLRTIRPSERALRLAQQYGHEARLLELILRESQSINRITPWVVIVRHRLGFTSANAGIDASNIDVPDDDTVLLLPEDPDASAATLRDGLQSALNVTLGLIISDTHGRPWRLGNIGVAIGSAGLPVLIDQRGSTDLFGRVLHATITPLADELAAATGLITGQADEGQPVVLVHGVQWSPSRSTAKDIIRPPSQDLYNE